MAQGVIVQQLPVNQNLNNENSHDESFASRTFHNLLSPEEVEKVRLMLD